MLVKSARTVSHELYLKNAYALGLLDMDSG